MYGWQREISGRVPEGAGPPVGKALAKARRALDKARAAVAALVAACPHPLGEREIESRARHDTTGCAAGGYHRLRCKVCGLTLLQVDH
jgi:hypothetical protein